MYFRLLGPFEVHDGEVPVPIGAYRQRAVLALLAIHAGQVLSPDRIIDEIWSGSPPPSALKTLHAYVSRLRKALDGRVGHGRDLLMSRHSGYVLAIDGARIDAVCFERVVDESSQALSDSRPEEAAARLREALGLWRGPPLADFTYETFAANESHRLTERRFEAVELRIEADLALARHSALVAELEGLVAEHPTRERLWAQLMTALYRSGRQADALGAYGRVRHALVEELGLEPGPELRRLEQQVLEQSADLAWRPVGRREGRERRPDAATGAGLVPDDAAVDSPHSGHRGRPPRHPALDLMPLVGRQTHLRRFDDLLAGAGPDRVPDLVLVTGEPGIGKSRLLAEFSRRARAAGALVAVGSAGRESSLPFGPFAHMIRTILEATGPATMERSGHLRADLAWLLPELGPRPATGGRDLALARTRLAEAVLQFLAGAGSGEPLVLAVDDAQGMGEGTFSLVHALLDREWSRPVVVILAVRTEGTSRRADRDGVVDLLRRERARLIELGRLSATDLTALVERSGIPGAGTDVGRLAVSLREQTAGIPLLVREVLAEGTLPAPGTEHRGLAAGPVSPLIGEVIGRHLRGLPTEVLRSLEVAAVIGPSFAAGLVGVLCGRPVAETTDQLDRAFRAGIVVETGDPDEWAFDHTLLRDVILAQLPSGRQARLHGRVANELGARGSAVEAARHGLLAYTDVSAGDAAELVVEGSDRALAALDFESARQLCSEALAGPAAGLSPAIRAQLLARLGRAQSLMGETGEAERSWAAAAEQARLAGGDETLARIALSTDTIGSVNTGSSDLRWNLLAEALERTGPGWSPLRLLVASQWALEASMPNRGVLSLGFVEEVVEAAGELGDPYALAAVYDARLSMARGRLLPDRRRWSDELRALAEDLDADEWLFRAHLDRLVGAAEDADGPALDRALDQLRETCARYRVPHALWIFELASATCARLRGAFDIADEHMLAAARLGDRHGIADSGPAQGAGVFLAAYHRGGLRHLRSILADFAELVPEIAAWRFAAGLAAADAGDQSSGRRELVRGMEVLADHPEPIWLSAVCLAAELVGQVGADRPDWERVDRLLAPHAGLLAVNGVLSSEFGPTDRCLGILSAVDGDGEDADRRFAAAVEACRRLGSPLWELRTRTDWMMAGRALGGDPQPWWDTLEDELAGAGLTGALERLRRPLARL